MSASDSLCVTNMRDMPMSDMPLCGRVRIVAPSAGVVTIEALPAVAGGIVPQLESELTNQLGACCGERLGNPTSFDVYPGAEIIADVELPASASGSTHTFIVRTSLK